MFCPCALTCEWLHMNYIFVMFCLCALTWKWIIFWIKWNFWPRMFFPCALTCEFPMITHELYFRYVLPMCLDVWVSIVSFHVPWRVSFQWLHMNYIFVMFCPCALTCEFPACAFPSLMTKYISWPIG